MLSQVGLSSYSAPPGVRLGPEQGAPIEFSASPADEVEASRPEPFSRTLALGILAATTLVPAVSMAQESAVLDTRAVVRPGTSSILDDGLSPSHDSGWRSFGHKPRAKTWFDRDGNWADSGTAVTADQYAAMPPAQQKAFARRVGAEPVSGVPERALLFPAIGRALPGELIDQRLSYGREPDGTRTFGHRPVAGQLFADGRWKDTGTLVSADQAAAMSLSQQAMLGEGLHLGDPGRVAFAIDRSQDDPALVEAHQKAPNTLVTYKKFRMKPATALGMARLERKIEERFPGREVRLTATVGGRHTDPNHKTGLAVDFVVEPLTRAESRLVERMAWETGFKPYNEYVHASRFKTGDHIHVRLLQP